MTRSTIPQFDQDNTWDHSADAITPAGIALALGLFVVVSAGFMPIGAAHDARHSFAFPCH